MRSLLLSLLLCLSLTALAYPNLHFHNLNMSHGISDNFVRSISRDRWGMMWFATLGGINSYDGYRFRQYDIKGDTNWNDAIYNIYEDADGNLWVRGALNTYVYHREDDFFDANVMQVLEGYGMREKPERLTVDMDGNLWAWFGERLSCYDFGRGRWQDYRVPQAGQVVDLACRHGKVSLLMSTGVVWRTDAGGRWHTCPATGLAASPDSRIYMDCSDRLWIYTLHATALRCLDDRVGRWQDMTTGPQWQGKMITALMDDGDGNMWVGTDNDGIVVMDQQYATTALRSGAYDSFLLADNHIVCLYKDADAAVIWVGTSKQGAVFANLTQPAITLLPMPHGEDVSCITQDETGRLWMGFDSQGLGCQDGQGLVNMRAESGHISSNQVVCTYRDAQGRQWWGSYGGTPYYIIGGRTTFVDSPLLHYIIAMCEVPSGSKGKRCMWFATWDKGLVCRDDEAHTLAFTMHNSPLPTNNVTDVAYDGRHTLYVGTSNGLLAMDVRTHSMKMLLQEHVKALYVDKARRRLWVGLRQGIMAYDLQAHCMGKRLTEHDGLSHNYVWGICEDHYGAIWVSTNNGITCIAEEKGVMHLTPYYSEDGLGSVRFNNHAIACLPDGNIVVGGLGFLVRIKPQEQYESRVADYPVRLTGLSVNGERIRVGCEDAEGRVLLKRNIMLTEQLTLRSADRNICLEVASMNYVNQHKLHYVYRLHEDEPWVPVAPLAGGQGGAVIVLNALEAGHYALQVKVAEPEGMEQNPVTTLELEVTRPWYAQWWAFMLYVLMSVGMAVAALFRYKRNMMRRQAEQQREERLQQRQELNEAKLEFFTQVSHEIRTPLSLVITPLQRLVKAPLEAMAVGKTSDLRLQLELVLRNAQTLMQEITKILDVRNLDDILWIKQNTATPTTITINENDDDDDDKNEDDDAPRRTILIVEDTEDFRMFLHSCLIDHYNVLSAGNGQEALEIIAQHADEIALILSDIMMPVMDGMELCNRVKNDINLSHIPFIMLTARTSDEQMLSGLREGADDYITKPFNLDILLLRIQRLLKWTVSAGNRFRKMGIKPSDITVSHIDQELIAHAISLVEQNMSDPNYSIDRFCDDMAMSRSSLYKKLMAITGMSPLHFVRTIRIKRGRQLLETSGESISQIAYKTGLSPKQFAKYFKEEYGFSPSELKR